MNLKIKFHVSGETQMSNTAVFDRITDVLEYKKYRILSKTLDTLTFDDNIWRLRWNFEPIHVDGGIFEVRPSIGGQSVSLKYYFNLLYPIIYIAFFLIILISNKFYDGLWFFGAFYSIAISISILRVRSKGRELLRDVLTEV